jgi:hypothetical protein
MPKIKKEVPVEIINVRAKGELRDYILAEADRLGETTSFVSLLLMIDGLRVREKMEIVKRIVGTADESTADQEELETEKVKSVKRKRKEVNEGV